MSDLTRLNHPFSQILDELDSLYNEVTIAHAAGDVRPVDLASTMCELMRLFGRALAEMVECPRAELPGIAQP